MGVAEERRVHGVLLGVIGQHVVAQLHPVAVAVNEQQALALHGDAGLAGMVGVEVAVSGHGGDGNVQILLQPARVLQHVAQVKDLIELLRAADFGEALQMEPAAVAVRHHADARHFSASSTSISFSMARARWDTPFLASGSASAKVMPRSSE